MSGEASGLAEALQRPEPPADATAMKRQDRPGRDVKMAFVDRLPGRGGDDDVWSGRADLLVKAPGRWAVIAGERDRGRTLRQLQRFGSDGGRFEVAQRTVKGEEPRVYARWVADEGSGS